MGKFSTFTLIKSKWDNRVNPLISLSPSHAGPQNFNTLPKTTSRSRKSSGDNEVSPTQATIISVFLSINAGECPYRGVPLYIVAVPKRFIRGFGSQSGYNLSMWEQVYCIII